MYSKVLSPLHLKKNNIVNGVSYKSNGNEIFKTLLYSSVGKFLVPI